MMRLFAPARWLVLLAIFGATAAAVGCSDTEAASSGGVCLGGAQQACVCPGGEQGVQVCRLDQSGFDACLGCPGGSTGGGVSTGGAGGSGGVSTGGGDSGGTVSVGGQGGTGAGTTSSSGGSATGGSVGSGGGGGNPPSVCTLANVTTMSAGSCDLIAQDCADGLTCAEQGSGNSWQIACVTKGTGTKSLGELCTTDAECAPDLRCAGPVSRCTRPCCPQADKAICGETGYCDEELSFGNYAATLLVCSFKPVCTPWANDCPQGPESDCHHLSSDDFGCMVPTYTTTPTEGTDCFSSQGCEDSQRCVNVSGAGKCRWLCKVSDAGAPASGTVGGSPGQGGCPTDQTCHAYTFPSWLGYCD